MKKAVLNDESLDMDSVTLAQDWYRQAVVYTRDLEVTVYLCTPQDGY